MLKITLHDYLQALTFRLEGQLSGAWVGELRQSWQTASSILNSRRLIVDLTNLTFVDADGKRLLEELARASAHFVASGPMLHALVEEIHGTLATPAGLPVRPHRTRRLCSLLMALFSFAGAAPAHAETRLTLRDAVTRALAQNPQVQLANLNVAVSEQDRRIARSALLPQAGFQASVLEQRGNIEASLGTRIPGFPQHIGPWHVVQGGVGFSVPLFDLTLWRRFQASRAVTDATAAQRLGIREQYTLLVVSQYLGAMRATADVHAAASRVELAQALFNLSSDLQKHGVGTGIDTLRSNVQLQNEKQRLMAARTALETTLNGLVRLLNLAPTEQVSLADDMSFFDTPAFNAEGTLERAFAARPELQALAAQARALELQKKGAREARLPRITADGGWTEQGTGFNSSIPVYQYRGSLEVPLFTGGRIEAEIAKADLELRKVAQQSSELRNQIALQVKNAAAQLESARNQVEVANLGVKLAREEVTQARDRFEAGVANNIEIITAQDGLARANDNQIAALYLYNQARADLAHATGQMESLYTR